MQQEEGGATGALPWPEELAADPGDGVPRWGHAGSNLVRDFHGSPDAPLVVYSDGNHHMALGDSLRAFAAARPGPADVFYATTPPGPLLRAMREGALQLGNLTLRARPHVFIGPEALVRELAGEDAWGAAEPFMRSRGNVLLVRAGNPLAIGGIGDLLRDDVRVFISNPHTERASHRVYRDTAVALARSAGLDAQRLAEVLDRGGERIVFGERIHHRELPEALAAGRADVAVCYYHLALRYRRLFAPWLDFVPLGGSREAPAPGPGNRITTYALTLAAEPGPWGARLRDFLQSPAVTRIYHRHGLARPDEASPPPVSL